MKITAVKCYQAVQFLGSLNTYFTESTSKGMNAMDITIADGIGIRIKGKSNTKSDHIIVPFTNIAAIYPADDTSDYNGVQAKMVNPKKKVKPKVKSAAIRLTKDANNLDEIDSDLSFDE